MSAHQTFARVAVVAVGLTAARVLDAEDAPEGAQYGAIAGAGLAGLASAFVMLEQEDCSTSLMPSLCLTPSRALTATAVAGVLGGIGGVLATLVE